MFLGNQARRRSSSPFDISMSEPNPPQPAVVAAAAAAQPTVQAQLAAAAWRIGAAEPRIRGEIQTELGFRLSAQPVGQHNAPRENAIFVDRQRNYHTTDPFEVPSMELDEAPNYREFVDAAKNGKTQLIEHFLSYRPSPKDFDIYYGLINAFQNGHIHICRMILPLLSGPWLNELILTTLKTKREHLLNFLLEFADLDLISLPVRGLVVWYLQEFPEHIALVLRNAQRTMPVAPPVLCDLMQKSSDDGNLNLLDYFLTQTILPLDRLINCTLPIEHVSTIEGFRVLHRHGVYPTSSEAWELLREAFLDATDVDDLLAFVDVYTTVSTEGWTESDVLQVAARQPANGLRRIMELYQGQHGFISPQLLDEALESAVEGLNADGVAFLLTLLPSPLSSERVQYLIAVIVDTPDGDDDHARTNILSSILNTSQGRRENAEFALRLATERDDQAIIDCARAFL